MKLSQPALKAALNVMLATLLSAVGIVMAYAQAEPNGNYSAFSLSYRSTTFSTPICVGTECHAGLAGPSLVYAYQIIPNLALGATTSYLQSTGSISTLKSTANSIFLETIIGLGTYTDAGALVAPLATSLQACSNLTATCTMTDDTGTDLGVFVRLFLDDQLSSSVQLSYDQVTYQHSPSPTYIVGISLVTVLAKHHRLAVSADQIQDSNGNITSSNLGYGYSYLF